MAKTTPQSKSHTRNRRHKIAIIIAVVVLSDIFIFGLGKFTYHTVRCGNVPVSVTQPVKGRGTYILPGNYIPFWADSRYVCTEADAIERGVVKDPFNDQSIFNLTTLILMFFAGIAGIGGLWWWSVRSRYGRR